MDALHKDDKTVGTARLWYPNICGCLSFLEEALYEELAKYKCKGYCKSSTGTSHCMSHPEAVIIDVSSLTVSYIVVSKTCNIYTVDCIIKNEIHSRGNPLDNGTINLLCESSLLVIHHEFADYKDQSYSAQENYNEGWSVPQSNQVAQATCGNSSIIVGFDNNPAPHTSQAIGVSDKRCPDKEQRET